MEVHLASLGFCLACCRLADHLGMDVAGNGAVGADWMGKHHKDEALHQGDTLCMIWDHLLRPHFLELGPEAVQLGGQLTCPLDDEGGAGWTDSLLGDEAPLAGC